MQLISDGSANFFAENNIISAKKRWKKGYGPKEEFHIQK